MITVKRPKAEVPKGIMQSKKSLITRLYRMHMLFFFIFILAVAEGTVELHPNTSQDTPSSLNALEATRKTAAPGMKTLLSFRNDSSFILKGFMFSEIALQSSYGCHSILLTQGSGYSVMPFVIRNSFVSLNPLVIMDVSVLQQTEIEEFRVDLWGSFTFTCRAMFIDFTSDDNRNVIRFLNAAKLWEWPETKIFIEGKIHEVQTWLRHSIFRNSLHVLYGVFQEEHLNPSASNHKGTLEIFNVHNDSMPSVQDDLSEHPDGQKQGYLLRLFNRCIFCNQGNPQIRRIPSWSLGSKIPRLYLSLSEQTDNMHGILLHVLSIAYFPFVNFKLDSKEPGTTVTLLDSIDKRSFETLSARANFSYEVRVPKDMIAGVRRPDGSWNGALGLIQQEKADFTTTSAVSAGKLMISDYERFSPIDPFIIVSLKPQLLPQYLVLIQPFAADAWVSIIASIIGWAVILWALEKVRSLTLRSKPVSLNKTLFYSWAVMLEETPSNPPADSTGQMLVGFWLIFCLLISTGYRSSLVAHLSVQGKTKPIDNYQDMVSQSNWKWGCDQTIFYGIAAEYFKKSTTPVVQYVYKHIEPIDVRDGLEKVLKGRYSLLTMRNRISSVIDSKYRDAYDQSPFHISKQSYTLAPDVGWSFRKGAPFRPRFAELLIKLIEAGIIDHWMHDVMALHALNARKAAGKQETIQVDTTDDEMGTDKLILRMGHLMGVFLTYFAGIFFSAFIFITEIFWIRSFRVKS